MSSFGTSCRAGECCVQSRPADIADIPELDLGVGRVPDQEPVVARRPAPKRGLRNGTFGSRMARVSDIPELDHVRAGVFSEERAPAGQETSVNPAGRQNGRKRRMCRVRNVPEFGGSARGDVVGQGLGEHQGAVLVDLRSRPESRIQRCRKQGCWHDPYVRPAAEVSGHELSAIRAERDRIGVGRVRKPILFCGRVVGRPVVRPDLVWPAVSVATKTLSPGRKATESMSP